MWGRESKFAKSLRSMRKSSRCNSSRRGIMTDNSQTVKGRGENMGKVGNSSTVDSTGSYESDLRIANRENAIVLFSLV